MPQLLQDWLRQKFPQASQTTLRRMLEAGRVRVNGATAHRMKQFVSTDDKVEIADHKKTKPKVISAARMLQPMKLIFEDEHVLVIDKPCGLLTSTTPGEKRPTAVALIREYLLAIAPAARIGLIHRLDRDASGLLLFSKNEEAYRSLKEQFFEHTVQRIYTAITHGIPTPLAGRIESKLVELPDGTVRASNKPGTGDHAVTEYKTISRNAGRALLSVTLHTGRKHQIRAHLSERGVPIVGDKVYGKADSAKRLMLTATTLGFKHPATRKPMRFELPLPKEFKVEA